MTGIRPLALASLAGIATVTAAFQARANDPPWAEIFGLVQEDEKVIVTLGFHDPWGYPDIGFSEFDLVREGPDGEATVFSGREFDPDEGEVEEWDCLVGNDQPADCEETPDACEDCDGDGDVDCPEGECAAFRYFRIEDACVPPGETTYVLALAESEYPWSTEESLAVEDAGQSCETDDDGASGGGGASPANGCSASGLGGSRRAAPVGTALLMLLVGIVALRVRRSTGA